MDSDVKRPADIYQLVVWAHANRQRLILIALAVAIVGLCIGAYVMHGAQKEASANDALLILKPPMRGPDGRMMVAAEDYLKVAGDYPGTKAGARAALMGAGVLFENGRFKEAEEQFQRFLQQYPDYSLASQAQLGIAACEEAQGKIADAATKYKEFRERHPQDAGVNQASSALARLYEKQGKFDLALKLYEDLARGRGNDSWSEEAGIQAQELLAKHPELIPKPKPETSSAGASKPMLESLSPQPVNVSTASSSGLIPVPAKDANKSTTPLITTNKP